MDSPTLPTPPVRVPQTYPATHAEDAARVADLNRRAGALVAGGNLQKAMELYNESLRLAPQYAETYRQRALTLLRLGDGVQAQVDYARFLALDPQALGRLRKRSNCSAIAASRKSVKRSSFRRAFRLVRSGYRS